MAEYEVPSGNTSLSPGNGSASQNPPARLEGRDGKVSTLTLSWSLILLAVIGLPGLGQSKPRISTTQILKSLQTPA